MSGFIRRALHKARYGTDPCDLTELSADWNPIRASRSAVSLLKRALFGLEFGDLFMRCLYRMRPYEQVPGSADALHRKLEKECQDFISGSKVTISGYKQLCRKIVQEFDHLPITDEKKPRVGVVGEILVKFLPAANNHLVELLEAEGAEAVVPDLMDFLLYCFYNQNFKAENLGTKRSTAVLSNMNQRFSGTAAQDGQNRAGKEYTF